MKVLNSNSIINHYYEQKTILLYTILLCIFHDNIMFFDIAIKVIYFTIILT